MYEVHWLTTKGKDECLYNSNDIKSTECFAIEFISNIACENISLSQYLIKNVYIYNVNRDDIEYVEGFENKRNQILEFII